MGVGIKIDLEEIEHRVLLRLDGRLDVSSAPLLEKKINRLIEEGHLHLLLDFTRVDYLSSAGLRVLLSSAKKLKAQKGGLILFALSEDVNEVLKIAGFDKILHICSSEKDALQFHK